MKLTRIQLQKIIRERLTHTIPFANLTDEQKVALDKLETAIGHAIDVGIEKFDILTTVNDQLDQWRG